MTILWSGRRPGIGVQHARKIEKVTGSPDEQNGFPRKHLILGGGNCRFLGFPGFPVELGRVGELHAPFFLERAQVALSRAAWQEIRVRSE
jgi:hypothetical protein